MKTTAIKDTKVFNVYSILTLIMIIILAILGEAIKINLISILGIGIAVGYLLFGISHVLFSKPCEKVTNSINNTDNHK